MSNKVLIAAPVHEVLLYQLTGKGYELVRMETINQEQAFAVIGTCVGVITSTRLQLNKQLLDAAPMLRWIGRMGSGMEVIDVPYATSKGISCYSSPEGNCNAVAEHALGMLLSLNKKIISSNVEMKNDIWLREENRGVELEGKTIGIIGFGHTGKALAKLLRGFDMSILAYDKYDNTRNVEGVTYCESIDEIYSRADIVSFHVPEQEDTMFYFNEQFCAQMHKPFILLNTSRGKVVDTIALYRGISSGKILGACLDVFENEPFLKMSEQKLPLLRKLIEMKNVIVTPHIAGYSHESLYKMSFILGNKILG